jgi:hypothetical protein
MMSPMIQNGRGEDIEMKNIYIMATGNSLLNEADKDYEANYKQDLSLQDRFAGCMYKVYIDYDFELNQIMRNIVVEGKAILLEVGTDVTGLYCQRFVDAGPLVDVLYPLSVSIMWPILASYFKGLGFVETRKQA